MPEGIVTHPVAGEQVVLSFYVWVTHPVLICFVGFDQNGVVRVGGTVPFLVEKVDVDAGQRFSAESIGHHEGGGSGLTKRNRQQGGIIGGGYAHQLIDLEVLGTGGHHKVSACRQGLQHQFCLVQQVVVGVSQLPLALLHGFLRLCPARQFFRVKRVVSVLHGLVQPVHADPRFLDVFERYECEGCFAGQVYGFEAEVEEWAFDFVCYSGAVAGTISIRVASDGIFEQGEGCFFLVGNLYFVLAADLLCQCQHNFGVSGVFVVLFVQMLQSLPILGSFIFAYVGVVGKSEAFEVSINAGSGVRIL